MSGTSSLCRSSNGTKPRTDRDSSAPSTDAEGSNPSSPSPPAAPPSMTDRLREDVQRARRDAESEEVLEVMADSSGWSLEQMTNSPESITSMELFLLTLPRIPEIRLFPNMTSVKLMNIGLTSMQDLAGLTLVEELWLSDNSIRRIEGLDKMTQLRRLYLQGNEITSLDGLPPLQHLRELWLCRNKIKHVDAQQHLANTRRLRSLWLACNPISQLQGAFHPFLRHLREVNLAGCEVYCFSQIAHLRALKGSLKKLWFSDPLFGTNPICRLNNYATFTIHLLGGMLEQLDHDEVTDDQRALAEAVYDKKRIYYSMRLRSLERNYGLLSAYAQRLAREKVDEADVATEQIVDCLLPIQTCTKERQAYNGKCSLAALGALPSGKLEEHERELSRAVGTREVQVQDIARRLADAVTASESACGLLQERLCVELHSGGNVRLDEVLPPAPATPPTPPQPLESEKDAAAKSVGRASGRRNGSTGPSQQQTDQQQPQSQPQQQQPMDGYYDSANELLQNGFAVAEESFKSRFGITGVQVNRVFRIVNRGLRVRFDNRIRTLEIDMASPANRRKMVCLFSPVARDTEEQGAYLRHVLLKGMDVTCRKGRHGHRHNPANAELLRPSLLPPDSEAVPLTNSLFLADEERLLSCSRRGELSGIRADPNALAGQLVVSRVYLGKSIQALGGNRLSSPAAAADDSAAAAPPQPVAFLSQSRSSVLLKDYAEDVFSVYRTPPSAANGGGCGSSGTGAASAGEMGGRVWYCLDRALVLPEFVVDYSYTISSPYGAGDSPQPSSAPAVSLLSRLHVAEAIRGKLASTVLPALRDSGAPDWADIRLGCHHLLAFLLWCKEGNTVSQLAKEETERVLAAARDTLKDAGCLLLSTPPVQTSSPRQRSGNGGRRGSASTSRSTPSLHDAAAGAQQRPSLSDGETGAAAATAPSLPLTEALVATYCGEVDCGQLLFCSLRGRGLSTVPKEFASAAFATLASLDLSGNRLTSVSWFALAQAAPQLEVLLLQHNALTSIGLHGTRMPHLTTLNLAHNALCDADEFADVAACFSSLRQLSVAGNPVVAATDSHHHVEAAPCLILSYFTNTSLERLDHTDLRGEFGKRSLGRWRSARTVDLDRGAAFLHKLLAEVSSTAVGPGAVGGGETAAASATEGMAVNSNNNSSSSGNGHVQYDMTSLDPERIPDRYFEAALRTAIATLGADGSAEDSDQGSLGTHKSRGKGSTPTADHVADKEDNAQATALTYNNSLVRSMSFVSQYPPFPACLRHLVLRGHCIADLAPVASLASLELLDVSGNRVASLPDLTSLSHLRTLNLSFNLLTSISSLGQPAALQCLCASANRIDTLDGGLLSRLGHLRELYVADNVLTSLSEFYPLKDMATLVTLDVRGNALRAKNAHEAGQQRAATRDAAPTTTTTANDTRAYFIYLFQQLKVLDGVPISQAEVQRARDAFAGKMSTDLLAERARGPTSHWPTVTQLDLSQCALREVALLDAFTSLQVLKLDHNVITRITGVGVLRNLQALDLAFNRLGSAGALAVGDALKPLVNLTSLSLEANHINDLNAVGLQLDNLKFLNLKGNELQYLDRGLHKLPQLRELILDQNSLRSFTPECFAGCKLLTDISADENAIRATDGLSKLHALERLSLGANRLGEMQSLLQDIQGAPVQELVLVGNPIARKANYRSTVIAGNPTLTVLDKKPISRDERERAELTARQSDQYAVPAHVVIDMSFVNNLAIAQQNSNGNPASAMAAAQSSGGGGGGRGVGTVFPTPPVSRSVVPRLQPLATNKRGGSYGRGSAATATRRL